MQLTNIADHVCIFRNAQNLPTRRTQLEKVCAIIYRVPIAVQKALTVFHEASDCDELSIVEPTGILST